MYVLVLCGYIYTRAYIYLLSEKTGETGEIPYVTAFVQGKKQGIDRGAQGIYAPVFYCMPRLCPGVRPSANARV